MSQTFQEMQEPLTNSKLLERYIERKSSMTLQLNTHITLMSSLQIVKCLKNNL